MRTRKGQAALEYLVTYGWALLAILVSVGAFAYLGLLDVERYLPDRCDFGSQLECTDFEVQQVESGNPTATGYVRLGLRNNFGEDINVTRFWIASGSAAGKWVENGRNPDGTIKWVQAPNGIVIAAGNTTYVQATYGASFDAFFIPGERTTIPLTFEFKRHTATAPSHNVTGEVFGTVREPKS